MDFNSLPFNFLTNTWIPVSNACVLATVAKKPPNTSTKIDTSIAFSNPKIGAMIISGIVALTTPDPSTMLSPINFASGNK